MPLLFLIYLSEFLFILYPGGVTPTVSRWQHTRPLDRYSPIITPRVQYSQNIQFSIDRKREYLEGDRGEETAVIGRAMKWRRQAVTNYCRLRAGKGIEIGQVEDARCPRCGLEEETPDHIVFRCRKVRRVKDEKGRREWAREVGVRWDGWEVLASKKWVRMEDGQVDGDGKPILKRGDLMEEFFENVHCQTRTV